MAKNKKRGPKPRNPDAKKSLAPSKLLALILVLALTIPMCSSLIAICISGISSLKDAATGLSDEAIELRDLLTDSSCPSKAAQSIAVKAQRENWLPVLSVYYLPDETQADTGNAVMNTKRHMISASVDQGELVLMDITDPYQNAYQLQNAGLTAEDSESAAEYLHEKDMGLLSSASMTDNILTLSLPDGTFLLEKTGDTWTLTQSDEPESTETQTDNTSEPAETQSEAQEPMETQDDPESNLESSTTQPEETGEPDGQAETAE